MKKLLVSAALVAAVSLPGTAEAQVEISPHAAFANDVDFGVGAIVGFPLASLHEAIEGAASFTLYFPGDNLGYWEVNALLRYVIALANPDILPYVTAGFGIGNYSVDIDIPDIPGFGGFGFSGTEVGLKVGGGAKFNPGSSLQPFGEVLLGLGNIPDFTVRGGVSFKVGG